MCVSPRDMDLGAVRGKTSAMPWARSLMRVARARTHTHTRKRTKANAKLAHHFVLVLGHGVGGVQHERIVARHHLRAHVGVDVSVEDVGAYEHAMTHPRARTQTHAKWGWVRLMVIHMLPRRSPALSKETSARPHTHAFTQHARAHTHTCWQRTAMCREECGMLQALREYVARALHLLAQTAWCATIPPPPQRKRESACVCGRDVRE